MSQLETDKRVKEKGRKAERERERINTAAGNEERR